MPGGGTVSRSATNPGALAVTTAAGAGAAALLGLRAADRWRAATATVDRAAEAVIETGAAACAAWLAVGALIGLLYTAVGRTGRDWRSGRTFLARYSPGFVRRMAGVALGTSMTVALTAPGALATPPHGPDHARGADESVVLDLGWPATRPGGTDVTDTPRGRPPEVIVRPGDSLWSIVTTHLTAHPDRRTRASRTGAPDPARIAHQVGAWHAANRTVIGPDPSLIHPGNRLRPPVAHTQGDQP